MLSKVLEAGWKPALLKVSQTEEKAREFHEIFTALHNQKGKSMTCLVVLCQIPQESLPFH